MSMVFIETKEQLEAKLAILRAEMKAKIANMENNNRPMEDIDSVIGFYDDQIFWAVDEYEHCRRD